MSGIRRHPYLGRSCISVAGMAQAIEYKEATFLLLVHLQKKKTEVHQSYLSVCHSTTYISNLELTQRGYNSLNPKQPGLLGRGLSDYVTN